MTGIVDLFCGIGGVAEATRADADATVGNACAELPFRVISAIDIDRRIGPIYFANHGIEPQHRGLESLRSVPDADLWWLSPPCQPYTRRGSRLQERDPRSAALANLIPRLKMQRPRWVILENVPEFAESAHHRWLVRTLAEAGYCIADQILCPTAWGVPMRRPRFYLRAARDGASLAAVIPYRQERRLATFLEESAWQDESLRVDEQQLRRFEGAMRILDADDPTAVAGCFTSAYSCSPVGAGHYLCRRDSVRRFSPAEISGLMGFRPDFWWSPEADPRTRYRLLGNALSVTVVRALLATMYDGGP